MSGLVDTFEFLRKSKSKASVEVWTAALQSGRAFVASPALAATSRGAPTEVQTAVIGRWRQLAPHQKQLIFDQRDHYLGGIRAALKHPNAQMRVNAFAMALSLRAYPLIPDLVRMLEFGGGESRESAIRVLSRLIDRLAASPEGQTERDAHHEAFRRQALEALAQSLQSFDTHKQEVILKSFLQLAHRSHPVLRQLLGDPSTPGLAAAVQHLKNDQFKAIPDQLVVDYMADASVPATIARLWGFRDDPEFVRTLLRSLAHFEEETQSEDRAPGSNDRLKANLEQMYEVTWLDWARDSVEELSPEEQLGFLRVAQFSGLQNDQKAELILHLLDHGTDSIREASVFALQDHRSDAINKRIVELSKDTDVHVRAAALRQLKSRQTPGWMPTLIDALEGSEPVIREAARVAFADFTIDSLIDSYDIMDKTARQSTARIVKLVDDEAATRLREDLAADSSMVRCRAIEIARLLELVEPLTNDLIDQLSHRDSKIQTEACLALGHSESSEVEAALVEFLTDADKDVREVAQEALDAIRESRAARQAPDTPLTKTAGKAAAAETQS